MRIGIVGCGLIGRKRAAAAREHEIVVVADVEQRRAEELGRRVGARVAGRWGEVIDSNVDLVVVATSHDALAEIALQAVSAGKHVLVEKPAARSAAELEPLLNASQTAGRMVKVGFNHRFHPALQKAKRLVEEGVAGPIMYVRGRYGHGGRPGMETEWRCQPKLSGGGELIDQAPHLIDLAQWFLGDLTLEYGVAPTLYWNTPADDNCFIALKSESNSYAWLHATWTEWKNMFSFEIAGRNAKLTIDGLNGSYGLERLTLHKLLPEMGPPETTIWEYPFPDSSWDSEFAEFMEALHLGRRPVGDIEDAYAVLKIIDAVRQRAEQ
jgi:predicted dehydrogenase